MIRRTTGIEWRLFLVLVLLGMLTLSINSSPVVGQSLPSLAITPNQGLAGATIQIESSGWPETAAGRTCTVSIIEGVKRPVVVASTTIVAKKDIRLVSYGFSSLKAQIPNLAPGTYGVRAEASGADKQTYYSSTALLRVQQPEPTYNPIISISPTQGVVGSTITVTGNGFAAASSISISIGGAPSVASTVTDGNGGFFVAAIIPPLACGQQYSVHASDPDALWAAASLLVDCSPVIWLSTPQGLAGETVIVSGSGYPANSSLDIRIGGTAVPESAVTDSGGGFSTAVAIPAMPCGEYVVEVSGSNGQIATTPLSLVCNPMVQVVPAEGLPSSTIEILGSGFHAFSGIDILIDGQSITSLQASDGTGSFVASIDVPSLPCGGYRVEVFDQLGLGADAPLTILCPTPSESVALLAPAQLEISPTQGLEGDVVSVEGFAFTGNSTASIHMAATPMTSVVVDAAGHFSVSVTVPDLPCGTYPIEAVDASDVSATVSFDLGCEPSITLSPATGLAETPIEICGQGFLAEHAIAVQVAGSDMASGTTDAAGAFCVSAALPALPEGTHDVLASDGTHEASSAFFVMAPLGTGTGSGEGGLAATAFNLTVKVMPREGGSATPFGTHAYKSGFSVPLKAIASEGYKFVKWEGDVEIPDSGIPVVIMTENKTVTAIFDRIEGNAPEVIDVFPEESATDIAVDSAIIITFSKPMDTASTQAFSIEPEVPGDFSWEEDSLLFTPEESLEKGTHYTVRIDKTAVDTDGNAISDEFIAEFDTQSSSSQRWAWLIVLIVLAAIVYISKKVSFS